jgi:hypothetical protein
VGSQVEGTPSARDCAMQRDREPAASGPVREKRPDLADVPMSSSARTGRCGERVAGAA